MPGGALSRCQCPIPAGASLFAVPIGVLTGQRSPADQPCCASRWSTRVPLARNCCRQFTVCRTASLRLFLSVPRGTRIGTLRATLIPTLMGTLIPTLMGTQAIAYLDSPADAPFALVSPLSGAGSRAKSARDPAPLRYVGVPPTSRLGRTQTLDEGIQVETGSPAPAGR